MIQQLFNIKSSLQGNTLASRSVHVTNQVVQITLRNTQQQINRRRGNDCIKLEFSRSQQCKQSELFNACKNFDSFYGF